MTEPVSWIQQVRAALASPPPKRLPPDDRRQASVLVPLYVDAGELWTVLTRRTEELPTHKNQIAFPGGAAENGEDAWATAVREAEEEVGLEVRRILDLGRLDEIDSTQGFRVVPCVGALPIPFDTRINRDEIAEVFQVPLTALANPRLVEDREVVIDERVRTLRIYHVGRRQIWGLTAKVLQNLMQRLGLETVEV